MTIFHQVLRFHSRMWVKSIISVVLRTVRTLGAIFIFHAPVNNRLDFPQ